MAFGNEIGLVLVDIVQKCCLLSIGTPDLYGNADPYQRVPRSPKRNPLCEGEGERCRSPSIDQVIVYDGEDDIDKLVMSPRSKSYSAQVSPIPAEDVELAEEVFSVSLDNDKSDDQKTEDFAKQDCHTKTERRSSSSWKGFSLKKQLSRVDMKLKHTFSAPPEKISSNKRGSIFYSNSNVISSAERDSGEMSPDISNSPESDELPSIVLNKQENIEEVIAACESAVRPTELQLFETVGKPIRPPRKDRKRVSVDQKTPNYRSDTRLLSVPNIKYSHQQGLQDLRRKEAMKQSVHNNQAFGHIVRKINKLDSSFSRSRSSSMSSLENISSEAIQCLSFADSYTKKSEASTFPTLWVGTSLGSVLTVMLSVPPLGEPRQSQPVAVSPCGTIFRLKGGILAMSFLDCNGALIPYSYESWKDEGKQRTPTKSSTNNSRMSPPLGASEVTCDRQFVAFVSEKQARVVALPSQNCVYRQQLADNDFVVKAEIISLKDSVCLVCYISSGHITAYSLPSLRHLIDVDFLPLPDLRIARTFCFSNRGHGLFLSSPSEVQKFTVSSEFCSSLAEMVGDLFLPHDMPEPPKQSFFQGLFGGGTRNLDREELFGESSGRASRSVAKHIPGPSAQIQELGQRAALAGSEVGRAHQLMVERGAKLGQLEDRTERMMNEADNFQSSAHNLMLKYKDKKWYQL